MKHKDIRNPTGLKKGAKPTKERCRQNGGVVREAIEYDSQGKPLLYRHRAIWESPLDVYLDTGVIGKPEYLAGLRFHEAYYGAVLCRPIDMRPTSAEQAESADTKSDRLLKRAYEQLPDDAVEVVVDVCGHGHHIWNPTAFEKMRRGLGKLAIQWHEAEIEVCEHKPKPD